MDLVEDMVAQGAGKFNPNGTFSINCVQGEDNRMVSIHTIGNADSDDGSD